MTWQQQQEQRYLDRLCERWNEDGTRKGIPAGTKLTDVFPDGITASVRAEPEQLMFGTIPIVESEHVPADSSGYFVDWTNYFKDDSPDLCNQ